MLLATTRANILIKLKLLKEFCENYGMKNNQSKTNSFFLVCGKLGDSEPLRVNELVVDHCDQFIYLRSPFTSDGSPFSAVRAQASIKMAHVNKFASFLKKNNDIPLIVKKRMFDAALLSAIMHGCESWLSADLRPVMKLYHVSLKQLLGVRGTTYNDMISGIRLSPT